ncbi:thiol:disulfide interchange protein DsbA/DsbL [Paralcaligenes sp. KSB-10]|uniref:thiol:disulfide interchange protein DsbA/DsbL n=1 Tax=Paralcaligenes sp. KSB-10 TaxID=2901142 RepID=UPI001E4328D6|nr:thiol:disulfide interchange protein DsbA/DsbL [Paralcaligenes sp. KSB-10]UHL63399.1 thiol:disulfide interchange protein DsbA/DsbL [Paralcaligenes sp. KSB-10]
MSLKNLFLRAMAVITIGSGALFAPLSHAADASSLYVTLDQAQPSDTPDKIEVLEFFAYTCPHCNAIEPMVEKWVKTLPPNVVFHAVPVAFNASMADLQKLYYTLVAMNRLDLHAAVFKAIHEEHKPIYDQKAITDWIVSQGVDRAKFEAVFTSFGIQSKVTRANELAKSYQIEGTPSISVAGKYVTSPSMTQSYEGTIQEAQKLVEMATKK